ncbi:MAG: SCO family protein [Usitatibacter sp.]
MILGRFAAAALAATALVSLGACDKLFSSATRTFNAIDVTGGGMGGELRLTDHNGKPRTLADFRGKVVVVTFGFTHCPDVCPTMLADLAAAVKELGDDGARVQVLFVTVDPRRDKPELLREYVPAFHPAFLGLTGDDAALARVRKDFNVYASVREGRTPEAYTVDHSAQMFVFDAGGRIRLVIPQAMAPKLLASDLRILLNS